MNNLIRAVSTGWHFMRIVYLIMGAMLITQALQAHNWAFGMVGGLFIFQSLTNTGCCGIGVRSSENKHRHTLEETDYTEIK